MAFTMSCMSKPLTRVWSAVSALLLIVVAAHAVAPVSVDHWRERGSAFSASTGEVSLQAGTRTAVAKELVRLEPVLPPQPVPAANVERVVAADPVRLVPHDAAPPLANTTLQPVSPRAPPAA